MAVKTNSNTNKIKLYLSKTFFTLISVAVLSVLISSQTIYASDNYPSRTIKIIVPFGAGGGNDVACRFLAKYAGEILGKTIVVENMPGASGIRGGAYVAKSRPDGYTILGYSSGTVKNAVLGRAPFRCKDFTPIAQYSYDPEVLLVPKSSRFNTIDEFLDTAKTKGVSLTTSGHSTAPHQVGLMIENEVPRIKFRYVHANSGALQIQQLLGGHVDGGFTSLGEASGQIQANALRPLVVSMSSRVKDYPNLPNLKEKGINVVYGAVRGIAVPVKTPKKIVDYLDKLFGEVINNKKFIDAMTKAGYPVEYRNSKDFTVYMDQFAKDFKKIVPLMEAK